VSIDPGILIGAAGAVLATISLVYARSQVQAQRRQVEEMQRQTEQLQRAQHFETRYTLMKDAIEARQAWAAHFRNEWAPPIIRTPLERPLKLLNGNWEVLFRLRSYVEQLQEMFFARKTAPRGGYSLAHNALADARIFWTGNRSSHLRKLC
jgi:hypothetical protein